MKILFTVLFLFLSFSVKATPMEEATKCTDNCPYPSQLYKTDKNFATELNNNLKSIGIKDALSPDGLLNGVETPVDRYGDGKNFILVGHICGSDCFTNLKFLFDLNTKKMVSALIESGKVTLMGNPTQDVVNFLLKDENVAIPKVQAIAAERNDIPANTIWSFKDPNGRVLWDICGGKQSTCNIVLAATNRVAIVNRKSTNGCALGDFYVVAKPEETWNQYDTGTCSSNAYFSQGTMNNGQYRTIDVRLNGELVKRFPVEYWSLVKSFSNGNRPKWQNKSTGQNFYQTQE
ncbi:hypothetical protein [Dickeya chrysanthemi]|uniref:hypothetical protein n=1 Tax=Dickeya chrysanthemi TaxID=556 RepID=UPI000532C28E|nr:hypothetical protein [Dickeya chrysanthemi]